MSVLDGIYREDRFPMEQADISLAKRAATVSDLKAVLDHLPGTMTIELVHSETGLGERAMVIVPRGQSRILFASTDSFTCRDITPED